MNKQLLQDRASVYMNKLCAGITERCVGSEGNRQATVYFKKVLSSLGWSTKEQEFDAID